MTLALTWLYVPADRPDRARRALASDADVVILDLEDAVAPAAKAGARDAVPALLEAFPGRAVQVRINPLSSPWGAGDLEMVGTLPVHVGVRVPKVSAAADAAAVHRRLGRRRRLHCLIETAAGLEAAAEIARARGVASISLGEVDLLADLGVAEDDEGCLDWCRRRHIVAARAAGLPAPAMAVFPNVADLDALAASTRAGRRMGFVGRAAIHPRQLPVITAAFRPDRAEVERAAAVLAAMEHAGGTAVLPDGGFVDGAAVSSARRVLTLHDRTRS
jgi:citrate lyase subunit beta/citryl-CoA lyase